MAIKVSNTHLDAVKAHGERTYPNECCGFLLGRMERDFNQLVEVYPAENEWAESIREVKTLGEGIPAAERDYRKQESHANRYWITPEQYRRADAYASNAGLQIVGYYHSHPDHPAEPSGYDFDHSCFATQSYMIVSVEEGRAGAVNSFNKPDYEKFEPEAIIVEDD